MTAADFTARLRARQRLVGTWVVCDNTIGTERIAGLGYDYLCVDGQHGLMDHAGLLRAITAIDAWGDSAGIVRVPVNEPAWIGRALDTGARGVVVPLVDNARQAAAAVAACRYPPDGVRSYGPMRAGLRIGRTPAEANEQVASIVMIETAEGLANVEEICAVPGLDGVLVGPADLTIALGGRYFGDPAVTDRLEAALSTVAAAAEKAGIACGAHCPDGATAAKRFAAGFTFAMVSCDLLLLEEAAAAQLGHTRNYL
jgi:4-hydroxy-2-oxoheptanedioate aldolase